MGVFSAIYIRMYIGSSEGIHNYIFTDNKLVNEEEENICENTNIKFATHAESLAKHFQRKRERSEEASDLFDWQTN